MRRALLALAALLLLPGAAPQPLRVNDALLQGEGWPARLSETGLFDAEGRPAPGVTPYRLQTPLFSDYAEKFRYLYVPAGTRIGWQAQGVLDFPVGSVLVKSFGYPADLRQPTRDMRLIETRLLIRRASGWVALPYVWDADGKDATLRRAGTRLDLGWTHLDGSKRQISYAVPNVNQCKGCHDRMGALTPIGPKARNLAPGFPWERVDGAPPAGSFAVVPVWDDPASGPLDARARAYLDVNCGHCHSREGPANTSGLWLDWNQPRDTNLGFGKRPTAAGRGSAGMEFAIAPGQPDQSYLVARMKSLDPGIAMPELGRATVHDEGVALVSEWIAQSR